MSKGGGLRLLGQERKLRRREKGKEHPHSTHVHQTHSPFPLSHTSLTGNRSTTPKIASGGSEAQNMAKIPPTNSSPRPISVSYMCFPYSTIKTPTLT